MGPTSLVMLAEPANYAVEVLDKSGHGSRLPCPHHIVDRLAKSVNARLIRSQRMRTDHEPQEFEGLRPSSFEGPRAIHDDPTPSAWACSGSARCSIPPWATHRVGNIRQIHRCPARSQVVGARHWSRLRISQVSNLVAKSLPVLALRDKRRPTMHPSFDGFVAGLRHLSVSGLLDSDERLVCVLLYRRPFHVATIALDERCAARPEAEKGRFCH